jgi:hypothetical protein
MKKVLTLIIALLFALTALTASQAETKMAEGADSDWYMNVLADPELSRQFPYHAFADVNGDGVPVLIVSTTESAFIGAEDQARVYVYSDGEPK